MVARVRSRASAQKNGAAASAKAHLTFALKVKDGWPPVGAEGLPCERTGNQYRLLVAPLFLKKLSVDDVIIPRFSKSEQVTSWRHVSRSGNTTIWLMRLQSSRSIPGILAKLRKLGCNTVETESLGRYAINVPATIAISKVDACLAGFDQRKVAVAFPSFRHSGE